MNKNTLLKLLALLFLSILILISIFIFYFYKQSISDNISDWAAFSDYLNTIISLITLAVTMTIAYEISKIEDRRNDKNILFEKERLLREFRELEYKEIRNELQKIFSALMSSNAQEVENVLYGSFIKYRFFLTSNYHLFPFLEEKIFSDLKETLQKLCDQLEQNQEKVDAQKHNLLNEFVENMDNFNVRMQTFLMGTLK